MLVAVKREGEEEKEYINPANVTRVRKSDKSEEREAWSKEKRPELTEIVFHGRDRLIVEGNYHAIAGDIGKAQRR